MAIIEEVEEELPPRLAKEPNKPASKLEGLKQQLAAQGLTRGFFNTKRTTARQEVESKRGATHDKEVDAGGAEKSSPATILNAEADSQSSSSSSEGATTSSEPKGDSPVTLAQKSSFASPREWEKADNATTPHQGSDEQEASSLTRSEGGLASSHLADKQRPETMASSEGLYESDRRSGASVNGGEGRPSVTEFQDPVWKAPAEEDGAGSDSVDVQEEEEESFYDACESEEQQRKQSLALAEAARLKGNSQYVSRDFEGALCSYQGALDLAPAANMPSISKLKEPHSKATRKPYTRPGHLSKSHDEASGIEADTSREETSPQKAVGSDDWWEHSRSDQNQADTAQSEPKPSAEETTDRGEPECSRTVTEGDKPEVADEAADSEGASKAPDPEAAACRAACHANMGACLMALEKWEEALAESSKALELNPGYLKARIRRAQAAEKLDKLEDALADWKHILEQEPGNRQAAAEVLRLEPIVAEKREKLKEEMLGKLKDLGNSLLGHFGLSVDNFKAVKDPSTGSYSINFQQ